MESNEERTLENNAKMLIESTLTEAVKHLSKLEQDKKDESETFSDQKSTNEQELRKVDLTESKSKETFAVGPVEDPFQKATKFLEKHQLLTLFQTLTSDIVLKRPSDPLDFMIEEIEKIQEQDRHRKGVFLKVNKQSESSKNTDKNRDMSDIDKIGDLTL